MNSAATTGHSSSGSARTSTPESPSPASMLNSSFLAAPVASDLCKSFVLPSNFSPEVEAALKEQAMTVRTTAALITAIARAMFALKKYPTSEEYTYVACCIVAKYPFLKSPLGNGYVRLSSLLIFY